MQQSIDTNTYESGGDYSGYEGMEEDDEDSYKYNDYNSTQLFHDITGKSIESITDYDITKFIEPTLYNHLKSESKQKLLEAILNLQVGLDISQNRIVNRKILSKFIGVCTFFVCIWILKYIIN